MDGPREAVSGARAGEAFTPRQLRLLKAAVAIMGLVLVLGFAVVVARIVYVVARGGASPVGSASTLAPDARLGLPAGAVVRSLALSGDRLAVHYDAPAGAGIAILDLASGERLSQIEIAPH